MSFTQIKFSSILFIGILIYLAFSIGQNKPIVVKAVIDYNDYHEYVPPNIDEVKPYQVNITQSQIKAVIPLEETQFFKDEVLCMRKNIYFEARSDGVEGMQAVAIITMNRKKSNSKRFPNTVCGVVYQAERKDNKIVIDRCQFSWLCNGKTMSVNLSDPAEKKAWDLAGKIALAAVKGKVYNPKLKDAMFYHANYVYPNWAAEENLTAVVGNHMFYNNARLKGY